MGERIPPNPDRTPRPDLDPSNPESSLVRFARYVVQLTTEERVALLEDLAAPRRAGRVAEGMPDEEAIILRFDAIFKGDGVTVGIQVKPRLHGGVHITGSPLFLFLLSGQGFRGITASGLVGRLQADEQTGETIFDVYHSDDPSDEQPDIRIPRLGR